MRVFGDVCSRAVFGSLIALAMMSTPATSAQDGEPAPAEAPVTIEIIGKAPEPTAEEAGTTAPDATAKTADGQPAGELSRAADLPMAATASAGGSSGGAGGSAGAGTGEAQEKVDPFVGSFSTAVPIQVPPFHGIEPNLALTYNSSRGNGFVGVGWRLSGLSAIERASPGKGAPGYDTSDIFLLDGQELVACETEMTSPGCVAGGTHAGKIETYLRIKQDATANTWEITGRDGTMTTYAAVMGSNTASETGTYRWAMTRVADTHGNTVTYNWWCDAANECYPDAITYNGNTVTFYREERPDPYVYGSGPGLVRVDHRLKSVDVLVGADRARAYALSYMTSAGSSQSLVADVRQFGRDATIDGTGLVTGVTALPGVSLDWGQETSGTFTDNYWSDFCGGGYQLQTGDFNGDGKTDLLCRIQSSGQTWIALSNGDGSLTSSYWSNFCGNSHEQQTGDFNGDGMTDLSCRILSDGRTWIALANGDGTLTSSYWSNFCGNSHEQQTGDFNGDGMTDLSCRIRSTGQTWIALAKGDGTLTSSYWSDFCRDNHEQQTGDFNGDGMTDLSCRIQSTGQTWIAPANGDGTLTSGVISTFCGTGFEQRTGDFNGDGKTDLLCWKESDPQTSIALSKGDGTLTSTYWGLFCGDRELQTGDFNGDGKTDLVCRDRTTGATSIALADGDSFGTVTSVTNPLGGTTTVEYTPSSAWTNQNLPMVLQTVSAITSDDGRGNTSTTSYAYEGGLWDAEERRFLGFLKATTTLPCIDEETACPYSVTTFRQDRASAGRIDKAERYDGAGTLLTRALEEYDVNDTTAPYTALNTASESHIIVEGVTRRTRVTRQFDDYANVVVETGHGDADVTGDEITAATDFNPNESDYIVSLPARMRSFDGTDISIPPLTETRILYDDATDWQTPPARGDPTETQVWLDTEARLIAAQAEYDTYGNVTATIDPLGRRSEIDYDPVYHFYPIVARNPLYFPPASDTRHQTSTTWDFVCGVPEVTTDLNGNDTVTQYDELCRPTRTDLPDGGFTITSYHNLGDPTAQYVETQTPPAIAPDNIWSRTYMDGFGRPYRSTAKGPAVGQDITADTAYNDRGGVASQTAPYYAGDPVYTTLFAYDALNRPIETTHPDGKRVETYYGVDGVFESVTTYDELDHPVTVHLDAYGQVVRQEEPLDLSTTVVTRYAYDPLGRLTGITDDADNQWSYTHDSLGRTLTVNDPDLGIWTKTYDDAGQLLTQTDALGQVTRFTYDALGRMLTKTARFGHASQPEEVTTYSYDDDTDPGFHNVGLLTRAENAAGTLHYRYDEMGRELKRTYTVTDTSGATSYDLISAYDIAGRLIRQEYPDGDEVGPIAYDAAGRLSAIPGLVTSATYDASGNVETFTRANGVVSTYGYSDWRGWLDSLTTMSGATSIQNLTYGRDFAGQITSVTSDRPDEDWTYGYDALRRLVSATNTDSPALYSRSYSYDSIGNMLTNSGVEGTYSYPTNGVRPHAVSSIGSWNYLYDANGNMTEGAGRTFTYNGENRPTEIVVEQGSNQTYVYGPDGERWKTIDNTLNSETIYLGGAVEIASGVMTKYLPGNAKRVGSPGQGLVETFWLHHDHQGSIQAITDANGDEVQRFLYYPYGERLDTQGVAHAESKGWIGERQDATGLFYLHARYYDPVIGRFVTPDWFDPILPGVGLNRYAYSANNPINNHDPTGNFYEGYYGVFEPIVPYNTWTPNRFARALDNAGRYVVNAPGSMANAAADIVVKIGELTAPYAGIAENAALTTPFPHDDVVVAPISAYGRASVWVGNRSAGARAAEAGLNDVAGAWRRSEFRGTRVYQRDDIIDPDLADEFGRTNVQRMERGLAPITPDGKSIELHHGTQRNNSYLYELTNDFHNRQSRAIHINDNTIPSGIDRPVFDRFRYAYWKDRSTDFGGRPRYRGYSRGYSSRESVEPKSGIGGPTA